MARRPRIVKGRPLNLPTGLEIETTAEISKLVRAMAKRTQRELVAFFTSRPEFAQGQDATARQLANALVGRLLKQFEKLFDDAADRIAANMVAGAAKESDVRFRASLKELSGGTQLKTVQVTPGITKAVNASVAEGSKLIRSFPAKYFDHVKTKTMESVLSGNGMADLVPHLQQAEGMTLRRARNVAQDQTRKAYNNINAERMQGAGITHFEWMHSSGGVHPRELHITPWPAGLNGGIFSFADLPVIDDNTGETGIPGQAVNCRCRMRPVLKPPEGKKNGK